MILESRPLIVRVYSHPENPHLDEVRQWVDSIGEIPIEIVTFPPETTEGGGEEEVYLKAGPFRLGWPFSQTELNVTIQSAYDRQVRLEKSGGQVYLDRVKKGLAISSADRFGYWIAKHYMALINILLVMYVGIPTLAPIFMNLGWSTPAKVIYTIYKPLCHQLAYRSFFLFGNQIVYPRELAQVPDLATYEEVTGNPAEDVVSARLMIGDSFLGYKIALCERDIAIWGSLALFGIAFALFGRKWKSFPWWAWLIIGVIPMGMDGISQLPSLASNTIAWLPIRESTPLIRVISGVLFGVTTGWYVFPIMEETMQETRAFMAQKIRLIQQRGVQE